MENWTKQKTFDTVVAHLRKQNATAKITDKDGNEACKYLTEDGRMCAAGCLIKPEDYNKRFEGTAVLNIFGKKSEVGDLIESYGHDVKLVKEFQVCHDHYYVDVWEMYFQKIAKQFNLTYVPKTSESCPSEC